MKIYFVLLSCTISVLLLFSNCKKNAPIALDDDGIDTLKFENKDLRFEIASHSCPPNIKRLYFFNDWEGIALTLNGAGFITKDKGTTWQPITSNGFTQDLRLTNDKTLIASGYEYGTNNSFIAKSKDNGNTWAVIHTTPNSKTQSIAIGDDSVLYALNIRAIDTTNTVFKSNNGGRSWDSISATKNTFPSTIVYASPTRLLMLYSYGFGFLSTNAGKTWTQDKAVDFTSTYYINIYKTAAAYTLDGGNNWNDIAFQKTASLTLNSFYDAQHGYVVVNDDKLYKITIK